MINALFVTVIDALGGDSGEVFAIHILGLEPRDMTLVPGDVLPLELMSGATDPGDTVLYLVEIWNCLGCVHISYNI